MVKVQQVVWIPPPKDWIKINTDGSLLGETRLGSCGEIARDQNGNFVAA